MPRKLKCADRSAMQAQDCSGQCAPQWAVPVPVPVRAVGQGACQHGARAMLKKNLECLLKDKVHCHSNILYHAYFTPLYAVFDIEFTSQRARV